MKKIFYLATSLCLLQSCSSHSNEESHQQQKEKNNSVHTVGSDRDQHGCIPSAGQSWSTLKSQCIQVFNVGIRLNPIKVTDEAIISAFVVPNDDTSKLELFIAEEETNRILIKNSNGIFKDERYSFDIQSNSLFLDDKLVYQ